MLNFDEANVGLDLIARGDLAPMDADELLPRTQRVEVNFSVGDRVTGWDGGEVCMTQKPLPASYSCDVAGNAKYCGK